MTQMMQPATLPDRIDLLVHGARVLTAGGPDIGSGGVAVIDGRIALVAGDDVLRRLGERAERVIDAKGSILMPGLINAHCHAACTQNRGLIENLALEPWLEAVWTVERRYLTFDTTYLGALIGLAELLLSGVTTVMDMFWLCEPTAEAATKLGIRISTGSWFFDGPGMCGIRPEDWIVRAEAFFDRYENHPLVLPGTFPHASYTVGPDNLKAAYRLTEQRGGRFSTHAAETRKEQRTISERYGRTVIRHMDDLGLLSDRTVLAHCVHLDDGEIALLAQSKTTVAHNPASNLKLGSGVARLPDMLQAGVRVALGTDSCISGNDMDMWLAMRLAALLHKGVHEDPTIIRPAEVVAMATQNGAEALGLGNQLGTIEVGKIADFILVAVNAPHAVPIYDLATHIVYAAGKNDVTDVFVAGRPVVRNRRIEALDIAEPLAAMRSLGARIMAGEPL